MGTSTACVMCIVLAKKEVDIVRSKKQKRRTEEKDLNVEWTANCPICIPEMADRFTSSLTSLERSTPYNSHWNDPNFEKRYVISHDLHTMELDTSCAKSNESDRESIASTISLSTAVLADLPILKYEH
jgi:hypothetical protein